MLRLYLGDNIRPSRRAAIVEGRATPSSNPPAGVHSSAQGCSMTPPKRVEVGVLSADVMTESVVIKRRDEARLEVENCAAGSVYGASARGTP